MAKWERLIVYPLLFVALFFGVARETRILQAAESVINEIRARRVVVVDEAGREQVVIRGARKDQSLEGTGGQIEIFGGNGRIYATLGTSESGGLLLVRNPANDTAGYLWADQKGGQIKLFAPGGEGRVTLLALTECGMFGLNNPVDPKQPGVLLAAGTESATITLANPVNTEHEGITLSAMENGGLIMVYNKIGRLKEVIGSP